MSCSHPEHWAFDFGKRDTQYEIAVEIGRWFRYKHNAALGGIQLPLNSSSQVRETMEKLYWETLFKKDARKIGEAKKKTLMKEVVTPLVDEFVISHRALIAELEIVHG